MKNQLEDIENPSSIKSKPFDTTQSFKAKIKTQSCIDFFILETEVPMDFVHDLNEEIDVLRTDENREDYSGKLVGQATEQISLERNANQTFTGLYGLAESASLQYCKTFNAMLNESSSGMPAEEYTVADCYECWSVHSFAGDYNPIHDHGNRLEGALSFVLYTKVPDEIRNKEAKSLHGASGMLDGCITFTNGSTSQKAFAQLRYPKIITIVPQVAKLLVFPHWLNHMVYPFRCGGERRSISGNVTLLTEEIHRILMSQSNNGSE